MVKYTIQQRLPSLNEYINACRSSKYGGNTCKQSLESEILWYLTPRYKITKPVHICFIWHEPNKKRDKDNVCFAKKFILDALQKAGILSNDSNRYVKGFSDIFIYDGNGFVEVIINDK